PRCFQRSAHTLTLPPFPTTTLFRSAEVGAESLLREELERGLVPLDDPRPAEKAAPLEDERELSLEERPHLLPLERAKDHDPVDPDRKSTRLNSSHGSISYAVLCLKK